MPGLLFESEGRPAIEENDLRSRLNKMPIMQSSRQLYQQTKTSSDVWEKGMDIAEKGFSIASKPLLMAADGIKYICPDKVAGLEKNACEYLTKIEERCPSLKLPTEQLIDNMRECVASHLREGVRHVSHSPPSHGVLWGLNCLLGATEKLLDALGEPPRMPKEKDVRKKTKQSTSLVRRVVVFPVTLPLKSVALFLRLFIRWLQSSRKNVKAISYEKKQEIEKRRKVSPRKRLPSSGIAGMLIFVARRLGLIRRQEWNVKDVNIYMKMNAMKMKTVKPESMSPLSAECGKRKHDVMLQEEEWESDEELDVYNLDGYCSAEDSDYQPNDEPSDESLEFEEGDTESDIEVEFDGDAKSIGLNLQAVRIEGPRRSPRLTRSAKEPSETNEHNDNEEGFEVVKSKKSKRKMKSTITENNNDLEKLPEILVSDPGGVITPIKDPISKVVKEAASEGQEGAPQMNGHQGDVMTPDNKATVNGEQKLLTPHLNENGRLEYTPTMEGDALLVGMKNNNDSGFDATPI